MVFINGTEKTFKRKLGHSVIELWSSKNRSFILLVMILIKKKYFFLLQCEDVSLSVNSTFFSNVSNKKLIRRFRFYRFSVDLELNLYNKLSSIPKDAHLAAHGDEICYCFMYVHLTTHSIVRLSRHKSLWRYLSFFHFKNIFGQV